MVMVLNTVGLPVDDIAYIIAVDWLLYENYSFHIKIYKINVHKRLILLLFSMNRDRFRTTINVMCDTLGAVLVDHLSRNDLKDKPCPEMVS